MTLAMFLALALIGPSRAEAALYSTAGGYQHTGGSSNYWGDELWTNGSLRLQGGWYPYGRLTVFTDSFYRWVLAPTAGLEKGFPGLGKARAGYTYYRGDLRSRARSADSHALEAGWFRAFSERFSGDAAYQLITGDLFAGENHEFNAETGAASFSPRYVIIHQGQLTLGVDLPFRGDKAHLSVGAAAAWTSDRRRFLTQTLNAVLPVRGPLAFQGGVTLVQSADGHAYYVSGGLLCAFSGSLH